MINDVALILIFTYTTHALIDKMQNCIEIFMVMNINVGFIKIYIAFICLNDILEQYSFILIRLVGYNHIN